MWATTDGKAYLKPNNPGIGVADDLDFKTWQSHMQRRKVEMQRKYASSTNEDFQQKLRTMEDWWNES